MWPKVTWLFGGRHWTRSQDSQLPTQSSFQSCDLLLLYHEDGRVFSAHYVLVIADIGKLINLVNLGKFSWNQLFRARSR